MAVRKTKKEEQSKTWVSLSLKKSVFLLRGIFFILELFLITANYFKNNKREIQNNKNVRMRERERERQSEEKNNVKKCLVLKPFRI